MDMVRHVPQHHGWMGDARRGRDVQGHVRGARSRAASSASSSTARRPKSPRTRRRSPATCARTTRSRSIEKAGFKLIGKSEINANPKDTTDHPHGVWSLPPTLEGGDVDRDKFLAIGESDRLRCASASPSSRRRDPSAPALAARRLRLALAQAAAPPTEPVTLRVMTFNVWYGGEQVSLDKIGAGDPRRGSGHRRRAGGRPNLERIAEAAGMPYVDPRRRLLSRWPIFDSGTGVRTETGPRPIRPRRSTAMRCTPG
jgi:hypothetical protein